VKRAVHHAQRRAGGAGRAIGARPRADPVRGAILALQRTVGNAATSTALRRRQSTVQRQPSPGGTYTLPRRPKGFELAFPKLQRYGEKTLKAGTLRWSLMLTSEGQDENKNPSKPSAIMQVVFTPTKAGRSLSFLQTVATAAVGKTAKPGLDVLPDDFDPFYGADWDPKSLDWVPENAPPTFRNAPSQPGDPSAYLYDEPWAPPSTVKMFETVVVDMRSGAQFGALRWGVGGGRLHAGEDADCTDLATSDFGVAVDEYYATPGSGSTASITRYEAILDEFAGSDSTLSDKHRSELNRVATTIIAARRDVEQRNKNVAPGEAATPLPLLLLAGFGDAMDRDPMTMSQQRNEAVKAYLVQRGVPADAIKRAALGDKWARAVVSMKEGRNRRVQIRIRY
jgi:hypothetical protein